MMDDKVLEDKARKLCVNLGLWGDPHFDSDVLAALPALREVEEQARREMYAEVDKLLADAIYQREEKEKAEAEVARLRAAAEYACDEHEKECGTQCSECTGMMELRAALRGDEDEAAVLWLSFGSVHAKTKPDPPCAGTKMKRPVHHPTRSGRGRSHDEDAGRCPDDDGA